MIVIIEGCDLAGKSYAIEKIGKHFNSGFTLKNNFKPINNDSPEKIFAQYWTVINLVKTFSENTGGLVILDRFYPSQAVYSILRGVDEFEHPVIIELEEFCKENDVKIIYLDTPLKVLKDRFLERGDEHIAFDQLKLIKERYDAFMAFSTIDVLYLNTLELDWLKKVEDYLGIKGGKR